MNIHNRPSELAQRLGKLLESRITEPTSIAYPLVVREIEFLRHHAILQVPCLLHEFCGAMKESFPPLLADWGPQTSSPLLRLFGVTETDPWRWGLVPERAWLGTTPGATDFSLVFPRSQESHVMRDVRGFLAESGWPDAPLASFQSLPLPLEDHATLQVWTLDAGRHMHFPGCPGLHLQLVFCSDWERLSELRFADPEWQLDSDDPAMVGQRWALPTASQRWMSFLIRSRLAALRALDLEDLALGLALESRPDLLAQIRDGDLPSLESGDPEVDSLLQPTGGCVVYQEQFLRLCRRLGGWDWGRADRLRRAFGIDPEAGLAGIQALAEEAQSRGWNSAVVVDLIGRMSHMPLPPGVLKAHVVPRALRALETAIRLGPGRGSSGGENA